MPHIVVVGAGQAGASLVGKLRNLGFDSEISLIGAEDYAPYQRPPLSKKYLLGDMSLDRLYLKPPSFYQEQDINLILGASVDHIDGYRLTVAGKEIKFDQLALTTGSYARRLPASIGGHLPGIYVIRTLSDVELMAPEFVAGRRVLIIGGGYIGLEAAAVATSFGLKVTLLEAADRILQRVACIETSDYYRDLHRSRGVEIIEGVGLSAVKGHVRAERAELADARILEFDFVICGIGVDPHTQLAQALGLKLDNGIAVDDYGRTSADHTWAAGDCASFLYQGKRIRLESVPHAIKQAENTAANMLGADEVYKAEPWFWSDQYDVKLQIAGLNTGYDQVVARRRNAAVSFWYYQGDKLLAVDAMNDPRSYMTAKRMINDGTSPLKSAVADPDADLSTR